MIRLSRTCWIAATSLIALLPPARVWAAPPAIAKRPVAKLAAAQTSDVPPAADSAAKSTPALSLPLDGREGRNLLLENFRPVPMLKVPAHRLTRAKFPVVDVHTHPRLRLRGSSQLLANFVDLMDRHNIAVCISLDGRLGPIFAEHAAAIKKYPHRFVLFANVDWQGDGDKDDQSTWAFQRPGFVRRTVADLRAAKAKGAAGLKLFKTFGLGLRTPDDELVKIDDRRFDPIWQACGELGLVVLIHTADPAAFFLPIDATNERFEELRRHPDWGFHGPRFPSREALLAARNRLLARHPKTTFIGAHMANNSEDLATVGRWLDKYPNLFVEPASRIGELGRQPYTARKFCLKYADRILFGTDGPWPETRVSLYWRFFETFDENFPYSEKEFPPQGFWRIHGLGLPDDVLKKLYHENAARLMPAVKAALAAQRKANGNAATSE